MTVGFSLELRVIIEQHTQGDNSLSKFDKMDVGRKRLFDFNYPVKDKDFKRVFERDFIRNFYVREIGFETEELFKMRLENWLNINMPYWNEMIESTKLQYDPLVNSTMSTQSNTQSDRLKEDERDTERESHMDEDYNSDTKQDNQSDGTMDQSSDGKTDSKTKTTNDTKDDSRKIHSDNPDSRLKLTTKVNGKGVIEYASDLEEISDHQKEKGTSDSNQTNEQETNQKTHDESNANVNTDSTNETDSNGKTNEKQHSKMNNMEDFVQNRSGKVGSITYSEMVQQYRQSLLRIEKTMFREMERLFMLVYD